MKLLQADYAWELHDDLLWILAELGGLPPPRVRCGVQQLRDGILGLLPAAIYYSILQLDNGLPRLLSLWCDLLSQRLQMMRGLLWVLVERGVAPR